MIPNPKYVIKRAKDGQYYFNLTAINGMVICSSEMYKTLQGACHGIERVRESAPIAEIDDQSELGGLPNVDEKQNVKAALGWINDQIEYAESLGERPDVYYTIRAVLESAPEPIEDLEDAIRNSEPEYLRALQKYETKQKNFYGMNKDRPKKHKHLILMEAAKRYHELTGGGDG